MVRKGTPSAFAGANAGGPLSARTTCPAASRKLTFPVARSTFADTFAVFRITVPGASLTEKLPVIGLAVTIRLCGRLKSFAGVELTRMIPSPSTCVRPREQELVRAELDHRRAADRLVLLRIRREFHPGPIGITERPKTIARGDLPPSHHLRLIRRVLAFGEADRGMLESQPRPVARD